MCTVCGCGEGNVSIDGHDHHSGHAHEHGRYNADSDSHRHSGTAMTAMDDNLDFGQGAAHAHAPGLSQTRMIQIEQDILGKNDRYAEQNRQRFDAMNLFALNLVSSPGSGIKAWLLSASRA